MKSLEPGEERRIRSLLPRVRDPKVREAAESLLDGRNQMIPDITPLIDALKLTGWKRYADQMVAVWSLGKARLTLDQAETAGDVLAINLSVLSKRGNPDALLALPIPIRGLRFVVIPLVAAIGFPLLFWDMVIGKRLYVLPFVVIAVAAIIFAAWKSERTFQLYVEATRALGRLAPPKHVGILATVYCQDFGWRRLITYNELFAAVEPGLLKTLMLAGESEGEMFTTSTTSSLESLIRRGDESMVLAALRAIAVRGQPSAIRAIEQLSMRARSERVMAEAESTIRALVDRHNKAEESRLLLRSSSSHAPDSELLRSAESGVSSESTLLRTVESAHPPIEGTVEGRS